MKNLLLIFTVAAGLCAATAARAQTAASNTSRNNSSATASGTATTATTNGATISRRNSRTITRQQRAASTTFVAPASGVDGVVARAARSGQPLQMVNPAAPAEFGTGRDVTRREVDDPYQRPQGIKLVTVEF